MGDQWTPHRLEDVDRWEIWPEMIIDGGQFTMPTIDCDGTTLCFAYGADHAFCGARTEGELEASSFVGLGEWSEPYHDDGPAFALE